jgi:lipoate-protein ligase B
LKRFSIEAYSRKDEIDPRTSKRGIRGAWYSLGGVPKKIVAQGLQIESAGREDVGTTALGKPIVVTMHGFALNGNTDLTKFERIYPCGFQHDVMSSMEVVLGKKVDMNQVKNEIVVQLGKYASKW